MSGPQNFYPASLDCHMLPIPDWKGECELQRQGHAGAGGEGTCHTGFHVCFDSHICYPWAHLFTTEPSAKPTILYFYWENEFFSCLENSSLIRKLIPLVQVYHIKHTLWWIDNSFQSQIIIILLPFCKKETSSEKRKALWYFEKLDCSWLT